jgi:hypothetical protein
MWGESIMKKLQGAVAVLTAVIVAPCTVLAAPFCAPLRTFREVAAESQAVVFGAVDNPREGLFGSSVDFSIAGVIKSHRILRGKKSLVLPYKIEVKDRNCPPRFLIFLDVDKGKIDPIRGVPVGPAVVDYLTGMLAIQPVNIVARLRYCLDFVDHPEKEIANDALAEFRKVSDGEMSQAARKLPAAKLRRWLRDPHAKTWQLAPFAVMLGHCGTAEDAILLRSLAIRLMKEVEKSAGLDGVLAGYVLLRPKEGCLYLRKVLANQANGFLHHYSALRAIRYLHDTRPDVIDKQSIVEVMKLALGQPEIADLIIEHLRRWRCWDLTSHILPMFNRQGEKNALIRRAVLRYSLQCPHRQAAVFVAERRKLDSSTVADAEELLGLESPALSSP